MMILGAQLYTVRHYTQTEKDFNIAMKRISDIGYKAVQISAIGNISAKRVREICDEYGLKIVLTHTAPDRILNDTEAVINEHDIMGCDYIGLGMMPEKYRKEAWLPQFVKDYREPAKKIAAAGKLFMYHNHDFEFAKVNKSRVIEQLMSDFLPNEMGFTLDTYWVQAAGGDVCAWIEKLSDRIPCVHLKDMDIAFDNMGWKQVMAPVGEGNMNFKRILKALKKTQNVKYLLVEQDDCYENEFTCLEKSYKYMSELGCR